MIFGNITWINIFLKIKVVNDNLNMKRFKMQIVSGLVQIRKITS